MKAKSKYLLMLFFVSSLIFGFTTVIIHELGHFIAYLVFGFSPVLHFKNVSCSQPITDELQGRIIVAAGWVVTTICTAISLLLVRRYVWMSSLGIASSSGSILQAVGVGLGIGVQEWNPILFIINVCMISVLMKLVLAKFKLGILLGIVGSVVGLVLWVFYFGPIILP